MPDGLSHYDPEAELAADAAAAREQARRRENLRLVRDQDDTTGSGLPDPAEATGAESLGGGYLSPKPSPTTADEPKDWNLDESTLEAGRAGVRHAKEVIAASDDVGAKLRAQEQARRRGQATELVPPPPMPPRAERFEQQEDQAS